MFRKVLIANRGEIAVRVTATCQSLGIVAAVVYSDADRNALHVRVADEAYPIGPAPAPDSYLNVERVVRAAAQAGADALHPGYGFLSENPALAAACRDAGITFIGPSPEAMRLLGDKIAAKRLAARSGVPTVPGYNGDDQDDATLLARAREIGTPVLIKAAAGGGGRGMREVTDLAEFPEALAAARREARGAFGDDRVLLERLVVQPRHVEFQIFGDAHGHVLHLGERECSVQRRHQKIIEEAPSPAVSPELRAEMGAAAVRVARAAGYTNAGTAEFMLDPDGSYYFLEMNARLQVEHPVTEHVTGLDLVELQLRVAAGESLPFGQDDVALRGHAIECRVYAEDAARGFLPSTGRLRVFAPPHGPGIRVDSGVEAGDEVTVNYDPMLAKLIASGATREESIRRALWALRHFPILGVTTNVEFLARIVGHAAFQAGDLSTDFLPRHMSGPAVEPRRAPMEVLALAVLSDATERAADVRDAVAPRDPWRTLSGWLPGTTRHVRVQDGTEEYQLSLSPERGGGWSLRLGDGLWRIAAVERDGAHGLTLRGLSDAGSGEERVVHGYVVREGDAWHIASDGTVRNLRLPAPPDVDAVAGGHAIGAGESHLTAPMPGTIIRVHVRPGDRVEVRQRLVALEAMKMEHVIDAPYSGTVRAVLHAEGELVAAGDRLVEIEQD